MSGRIRAVVGLGNPGEEYEETPHNIGFAVVDALAARHGLRWKKERAVRGWVAKGCILGEQIWLLKPRTYMNESGGAVLRLLREADMPCQQLLVVVDDADLPLGRVRLRATGGTGGHRGLKSIRDALSTSDYPRLRIGIGRGSHGREGDLARHVLGRFSKAQREKVEKLMPHIVDIVERCFAHPLEEVMNVANVFGEEQTNDG